MTCDVSPMAMFYLLGMFNFQPILPSQSLDVAVKKLESRQTNMPCIKKAECIRVDASVRINVIHNNLGMLEVSGILGHGYVFQVTIYCKLLKFFSSIFLSQFQKFTRIPTNLWNHDQSTFGSYKKEKKYLKYLKYPEISENK